MKFMIPNIKIEKDIPYPVVITKDSLNKPPVYEIVTDIDFMVPFPTFTGSIENHLLIDTLFKMQVGDSFLAPHGWENRIGIEINRYTTAGPWCINHTGSYMHWQNEKNEYQNRHLMHGRIFKNKSINTEDGYVRRYWRIK